MGERQRRSYCPVSPSLKPQVGEHTPASVIEPWYDDNLVTFSRGDFTAVFQTRLSPVAARK